MNAYAVLEPVEEVPAPIIRPTVAKIQAETALLYGIPVLDMVSNRRSADVAFPRQVAMYLCRTLTVHSFLRIGNFFGRRDHTTVIHACNLVRDRLSTDPELEGKIEYLKARLA